MSPWTLLPYYFPLLIWWAHLLHGETEFDEHTFSMRKIILIIILLERGGFVNSEEASSTLHTFVIFFMLLQCETTQLFLFQFISIIDHLKKWNVKNDPYDPALRGSIKQRFNHFTLRKLTLEKFKNNPPTVPDPKGVYTGIILYFSIIAPLSR